MAGRPGSLGYPPELMWKCPYRLAVEAKRRNGDGRPLRQDGERPNLGEQLSFDLRTLWKPEDPLAVHLEGRAVAAFAEIDRAHWSECRELRLDHPGNQLAVQKSWFFHCRPQSVTSPRRTARRTASVRFAAPSLP